MTRETPMILVVAPTGNHPAGSCSHLPLQPAEIARVVNECCLLGASIVHLHARDPQGKPTSDPRIFQEMIRLIRAQKDVILQISTGGAGIEEILELTALDAEMLSLDTRRFIDSKESMQILLEKFKARKIKPELEIFNEECAHAVAEYVQEGLLELPVYCNLVIPVTLSYQEGLFLLNNLISKLPEECIWVCCRGTLPLRITAALLGGNIRAGLEDALMEPAAMYDDNVTCFREMVEILKTIKIKPANSKEIRRILKLSYRTQINWR